MHWLLEKRRIRRIVRSDHLPAVLVVYLGCVRIESWIYYEAIRSLASYRLLFSVVGSIICRKLLDEELVCSWRIARERYSRVDLGPRLVPITELWQVT
jgi:hypothetical protein